MSRKPRGVCQDVTTRTQVETALQETVEELTRASKLAGLLTELTVHANEAASVPDAMRKALESVYAYTGWPVGHALVLSPEDPGSLVSLGVWHLAGLGCDQAQGYLFSRPLPAEMFAVQFSASLETHTERKSLTPSLP